MLRKIIVGALAAAFLLAANGCGSYMAVKTGTCKEGRTWVAPTKDAQGNWKAGYCKDQ